MSRFGLENNILRGPEVSLPLGDSNIGRVVLEILRKNSDFVGQIDAKSGESSTYGKLADESVRCALWLKNARITHEDVISIYGGSSILLLAPYLATLYVGLPVIARPPNLPTDTTRYYMNIVKPKVVFASVEAVEEISDILKEEEIDARIIVLGHFPGFESFYDIIKQPSLEEVVNFNCSNVNPNDLAVILMSSGSTGVPKLVSHSYAGLLHRVLSFLNDFWPEKNSLVTTWITAIAGIVSSLFVFSSFLTNSPMIIVYQPTVEELCRTIEKYKVQNIDLPTDLCYKIATSEIKNQYNLSSLRHVMIAGSKLRSGVVDNLRRIVPNCQLTNLYGLTEMGGNDTINLDTEHNESCGKLCCNVQMKVIDLTIGSTLGPNERGEICMKRPFMMKEYYKDPEATKKAIDSEGEGIKGIIKIIVKHLSYGFALIKRNPNAGWFYTNDVGYFDEEGNVYILDRKGRMIKYKNRLVSPLEIEDILLKHSEVSDAAVIGVPHNIDGEHALAFVIKNNNSKLSEKDLVQFALSLGEDKMPVDGVIFVDELPFDRATGKLERKNLLKMVKDY